MTGSDPGTAAVGLDPRIHEQAVAVERVHFVKTDRRVNPRKTEPFLYRAGRLPLLVTAPRSVRVVQRKRILPSEEFTGSIAYLLHQVTGCHLLAVAKLYGGLPTRDLPCPFKDRLAQIVGESGVSTVLEIRGAPREMACDLTLATAEGNAAKAPARLLRQALHAAGLGRVSRVALPTAAGDVSAFAATELGCRALKLEINRRFRAPNRNGAAYAQLLQGVAAGIREMVGEYC